MIRALGYPGFQLGLLLVQPPLARIALNLFNGRRLRCWSAKSHTQQVLPNTETTKRDNREPAELTLTSLCGTLLLLVACYRIIARAFLLQPGPLRAILTHGVFAREVSPALQDHVAVLRIELHRSAPASPL